MAVQWLELPTWTAKGMDSIKPHGVTKKKKKKKRQEENNSITGKHGKGITRPEILEYLEISQ